MIKVFITLIIVVYTLLIRIIVVATEWLNNIIRAHFCPYAFKKKKTKLEIAETVITISGRKREGNANNV